MAELRPNVRQFIEYWRGLVKTQGAGGCKKKLSKGETKYLSGKDRAQLIKELGL